MHQRRSALPQSGHPAPAPPRTLGDGAAAFHRLQAAGVSRHHRQYGDGDGDVGNERIVRVRGMFGMLGMFMGLEGRNRRTWGISSFTGNRIERLLISNA